MGNTCRPGEIKFVMKDCCYEGFVRHHHAYRVRESTRMVYHVVSLNHLIDYHVPLSPLSSYEKDTKVYLCPIQGGPEITEQSIPSIFQDFVLINSYFLHLVG